MPTYEFLCEVCGPFEQRRLLQEAGAPLACPTCHVPARRLYSTAGVMRASGALRGRMAPGAEPTVVTRPTPAESPDPARLQQAVRSRPWQLGHATQTGRAHEKFQRL
jgi:putative FmdB family regulatory protein